MIYGYAILKTEIETYGLPCGMSDEYGEFHRITKVRLFRNKHERDNAIKLEIKNERAERNDILPFVTKETQGKLNFKTTIKTLKV